MRHAHHQGRGTCIILAQPGADLTVPKVTNDTIDSFTSWRRFVAHDYKYYSTLQQKSLATRVCEGDRGLEMSGEQSDWYENLFAYLGTHLQGLQPWTSAAL